MKMNGDIRVRISKKYETVYNSLSQSIGLQAHVLFFVCFCLATAKKLRPTPLEKKADKFWSKTFTPHEWTSMYTVILARNSVNMKAIDNDEEVVRQIEELANAGMEVFLKDLPAEYIRKKNNELSLAIDDKREVIKDILYLLLDQYLNEEEI